MKSTGLFGKNSGRVGGVVYSNYRGEQIVRAYQPKVSNPNTALQIAQRAKFKLLSQVASVLKRELNASYISEQRKLTSRNMWIKNTFNKVVYADNTASLPIEDVVLTNSRDNAIATFEGAIPTAGSTMQLVASSVYIGGKVRCVYLSYSDGGDIEVLYSQELAIEDTGEGAGIVSWNVPNRRDAKRVVLYAYKVDENAISSYGDIETLGEEIEVDVISRVYSGALRFSASLNLPIRQNV